MSEEFVMNKEKVGFREIVLIHVKRVLELSTSHSQDDSSSSSVNYARAVQSLSDVLLPFYDKEMDKSYGEYEVEVDKLSWKESLNTMEMRIWRRTHRKLFRKLNLLMKRQDYLKGSVYSEVDSDEDID